MGAESSTGMSARLTESVGVERWLAAARAGDGEALGSLLDYYSEILAGWVRRLISRGKARDVSAEDVVNETVLQAFKDFAGFRGDNPRQFFGWLKSIAWHRLADAIKDSRLPGSGSPESPSLYVPALPEVDVLSTTTSPSRKASRGESREAVRLALALLPPKYRSVIELSYWERLNSWEIGERLGMSEDAARKSKARALRTLRNLIGPGHDSR